MIFEKSLRKLFNVIFKGNPQKRLEYDLNRSSFLIGAKLLETENIYILNLKNYTNPVYIRNRPSSDYDVLDQVIFKSEYEIACSAFELNFKTFEPIRIVDAGANIGLTSLFFTERFPNSVIYALEPEPENFKMLLKNIAGLDIIKPLQNALSAEKGKRFEIGESVRDEADWSRTTQESANGTIMGITLEELLNENGGFFDILKIDIEGAERFIFDDRASQDFLDKTRVLVIEIHDEFNIRSSIYKELRKRGFSIVEQGELTLGVNTKLMNFGA